MRYVSICITAACLVTACGYSRANDIATAISTDVSPPTQTDVFVAGQGGYHTYRIPAVIVTKQATLLAFCEGRKNSRSDTGDIDLLLRRSTDGGATWSAPQVVWDDGPNTCGNPCPVVDQQTGVVWLLLTWNSGKIHERLIKPGFGEDSRRVFVTHSEDDGKTWAKPTEITRTTKKEDWTWYATGPGAGVQLRKGTRTGRLVIPCDHKVLAGTSARYYSHVIYSDDHGATWKLGGSTPQDKVNECEVVELADGRLMLNMRNYDTRLRARQVCFSDDGGASWRDQRHAPTLIEPICQASIRRYRWPSADAQGVILFSNPASAKGRQKLTIRASYDDGATWPHARLLHGGGSAYSCLCILNDHSIGCLFEKDDYKQITFARFPLDWVTEGAGLQGADRPELQSFLEHEIVGSVLPMTEVQRYCHARVPAVPKAESVAQWKRLADQIRRNVLQRIVYRGEAAKWRDAPMNIKWLDTIEGGPGYRIKKLRYEALPGMWIPALLYEPDELSGAVPAVLNLNGHTSLGKQYPDKQIRCINQAKRGMLALNIEWIGMGQLGKPGYRHYSMNQLDLCGTSGLAPFYLNMKRGLDVLLSLEHVDPRRVAVTGLSGGGWQTIILSSLDTRVKLADPVAGYSSFRTRAYHLKDLGDAEQTPSDLATICDYAHLTAMLAPRPTLLTFNLHDGCCFEGDYALQPLLDAAVPIFRLHGREDALRWHVNNDPPGKHNYGVDNRQQLYAMLGDFFYAADQKFDAKEIPSQDEVKTKEELFIELPKDNEDFNTLALGLAKSLPRDSELPREKDAAQQWQQARRMMLGEIVRAKDYKINAIKFGEEKKAGVKATYWALQMDTAWTVPAVELVRGDPSETVILVADDGRRSVEADAVRLLEAGHRVLAVDPFYFGESKIAKRDFLFALLVAAVGDRPLGLQASQVAAIARWSQAKDKGGSVALVARGPRSSLIALVAAGLESRAIGQVELHGSLGSLKEVIEKNWGVDQKPELFCFGLLESFDIEHLVALVAPRPVKLIDASDRAKTELAGLRAWYGLLGDEFEPLR